jgi:hypothetical protein
MVAWFSKIFTDGTSEWDARFERKKIGLAWAYRVRKSGRGLRLTALNFYEVQTLRA